MSRILIVDDDLQGLYMLETLLKGHGHQVETAVNGSDALEKARRNPPEMIISDFFMPTMDGFALCRRCKEDARLKDVPFIAYTATYTDPKDEDLALSLGAARFLIKPIEPDVLLDEVNRVFADFRAGRLPPHEPASDQQIREYCEALIRKLEAKVTQLQETNLALSEEMAKRRDAQEALHQREEQYRNFFELAATGMIQADPVTRRFLRVNDRMCEITGYSREELLSMTVNELNHPDHRQEDREKFMAMARGEIPEYYNEKKFIRKNGQSIWVQAAARMIFDSAGKPLHSVAVILDITERKRAEDELKALNTELEQKVAQRTALAETRAAQLKELAAMLTQTEQKERRRAAHILHEHVQQLLFAARLQLQQLKDQLPDERMAHMAGEVENILAAGIDASRSLAVELYPPVLYSLGLLPALTWLAARMKNKYGLEVDVIADPESEPAADVYKTVLFDSTSELLFNVVKHAKVKKASVTARRLAGQVEITITDKGIGFDVSQLPMQVGTAGAFGLFSIRERLDLVGGRLEIQSAPGRGSCFTITAPVGQTPETQGSIPPTSAIAEATAASTPVFPARPTYGTSKRKIRVLLVDDHAIVRQGIALALDGAQDLEIADEASDGQNAVELVDKIQPDVVLMDINMPGMNGIEATRIIHQRYPHIRVIGLSMFEEGEQSAAMLQAGASAYLTKSGNFDALLDAIRKWTASLSS